MTDTVPASQPISEEVARLLCPEAFRARDQFEQAMQRLTTSAGAIDMDVDRLKEEVMRLAATSGLSVSAAVDHLVAVAQAQQLVTDGG